MPITYHIDPVRKIVFARGRGTFTHEDLVRYQDEVWSRSDVAGFDELVDMRPVEHLALKSIGHMREIADQSSETDSLTRQARLAIVAQDEVAQSLGRLYSALRAQNPRSTKEVQVFSRLEPALEFLGIANLPENWDK